MINLEKIIKYNMDELEIKAFKIGLIWQRLCEKEFPNEYYLKFPVNGDPRKSSLFKFCYKLVIETKGFFNDKEYFIYVLAQLQMLKAMKQNDVHALIGPHILVGDKAWKRWKIWNKKFNKKLEEIKTAEELGIITKESDIKRQLIKTKEFLKKYDYNNINKIIFSDWVKYKKISPFYIALSDFSRKFIEEFDYSLYKPSITPEIEDFFKKEFEYEKKYI